MKNGDVVLEKLIKVYRILSPMGTHLQPNQRSFVVSCQRQVNIIHTLIMTEIPIKVVRFETNTVDGKYQKVCFCPIDKKRVP